MNPRATFFRDFIGLVLLVVIVGGGVWGVLAWLRQKEWFTLMRQQMATIQRLHDFPPPSCDAHAWQEEVVTLHNVWGNVTFHPSYSRIDNATMRDLDAQLQGILQQTSCENSMERVNRMYDLLLPLAKDKRFVSGYQEQFQSAFESADRVTTDGK